MLEKLGQFEVNSVFTNVQKELFNAVYCSETQLLEEAVLHLKKALVLSEAMEVGSVQRLMVEAVVHKLSLNLAILKSEDAAKIKKFSDESIKRLYLH